MEEFLPHTILTRCDLAARGLQTCAPLPRSFPIIHHRPSPSPLIFLWASSQWQPATGWLGHILSPTVW